MADQQLELCQRQAEEVTVLMKDNVEKVFERDEKLAVLNDRSEKLKNMAGDFQKTAQRVERKTRCEKWRLYIIIGLIIFVVLLIIVIILAFQFSGGGSRGTPSNSPSESSSP